MAHLFLGTDDAAERQFKSLSFFFFDWQIQFCQKRIVRSFEMNANAARIHFDF